MSSRSASQVGVAELLYVKIALYLCAYECVCFRDRCVPVL